MKLALVITVKNERTLLRQNIEYHQSLGIDHFYIYLDGTEDDTRLTINDLNNVSIFNSVNIEKYENNPYLQLFIKSYDVQFTARMSLNAFHAQELAKQAGYDWIISLDADELICIDPENSFPGQLCRFFESIPDNIETVRFKTLEVVQRKISYENVFQEETLFKRPDSNINHNVYDPIKKRHIKVRCFYGQSKGKSAVRSDLPSKQKTSHKYIGLDDTPLRTLWGGFLLHYYAYDLSDFLKKYQNIKDHPNTYLIGSRVEPIKQLWRDLVNDPNMTQDSLKQYYQRWVLFSDREVARLKKEKIMGIFPVKPKVIAVNSVKNLFDQNIF